LLKTRFCSEAQLNNYVLSGGGIGIHWDEVEKDIFVPGLLLGKASLFSASFFSKIRNFPMCEFF